MANEIIHAGQFARYGGPQITLKGSVIGNAVVSILSLEGTGTNRGWKLFDPTKADYLNTKKVLYPGDDVLVNALSLPMDFPLEAGGAVVPPDTLLPTVFAEGELVTELEPLHRTTRLRLSDSHFIEGSGQLAVRINLGAYGSLAAANTAIAALPASTFAFDGPGYGIQFRITRTALEAATASVTATY